MYKYKMYVSTIYIYSQERSGKVSKKCYNNSYKETVC